MLDVARRGDGDVTVTSVRVGRGTQIWCGFRYLKRDSELVRDVACREDGDEWTR